MTDLDAIEKRAREARERAGKATAGQWLAQYDERNFLYRVVTGPHEAERIAWISDFGEPRSENADFIASARTDVPLLADDVLALVAEVRLARAWLRDEEASVEACLTSYRDEIDEIAIESRKAYRAFLAKREAP